MEFSFARDGARGLVRSVGKWFVITTAIGLSTLPAACGGGGGDSGGTTPPPPAGTAPTITVQPQSQTVVTGDKATFSVTATGSATLSYQWNRNGTPISGQTSATYTTAATTLQDTGSSFTVVVSNSAGQVTSNAASLTANANPEGIYTGVFTASGGLTLPVVAIILKDGTAEVFATQNQITGGVLVGFALRGLTVKPNGTQFSSSFTGVTQAGLDFNGQSTLPGTLTGNVTSGQSITGTFTTSLDTGTFALTAQTADYARSASGATIAGTYMYQSAVGTGSGGIGIFNSTTTYAADGTGTGANDQGCNGGLVYSIPDASHNAYKVATSSVCPTGPISYSGLMAYFPAGTGASINNGVIFTRDTFLAIVENQTTSYVVIASK